MVDNKHSKAIDPALELITKALMGRAIVIKIN